MELFLEILGCIVFALVLVGLQALFIALFIDTDRKCINCPMRDECFKSMNHGFSKLCDNATPLDCK